MCEKDTRKGLPCLRDQIDGDQSNNQTRGTLGAHGARIDVRLPRMFKLLYKKRRELRGYCRCGISSSRWHEGSARRKPLKRRRGIR